MNRKHIHTTNDDEYTDIRIKSLIINNQEIDVSHKPNNTEMLKITMKEVQKVKKPELDEFLRNPTLRHCVDLVQRKGKKGKKGTLIYDDWTELYYQRCGTAYKMEFLNKLFDSLDVPIKMIFQKTPEKGGDFLYFYKNCN